MFRSRMGHLSLPEIADMALGYLPSRYRERSDNGVLIGLGVFCTPTPAIWFRITDWVTTESGRRKRRHSYLSIAEILNPIGQGKRMRNVGSVQGAPQWKYWIPGSDGYCSAVCAAGCRRLHKRAMDKIKLDVARINAMGGVNATTTRT